MSLIDKLQAAAAQSAAKFCKIGHLLAGDQLAKADKLSLASILDTPATDVNRVPNSSIGKILREEGHDISNSIVDRHRAKICSCARVGK